MSYSSAANEIKVGIVDDSPLVRQIIEKVVSDEDGMRVVGSACDPYEAREMIKSTNPDIITLDVEMPKMDGLSFLEKIMTLRPMPVIMVSTLTQKAADVTLHALQMGAVDYVGKPLTNSAPEEYFKVFRSELVPKINMANLINANSFGLVQQNNQAVTVVKPHKQSAYDLIGIASSTGGVERLRYLISRLSVNVPPILIVQHINKNYIANMVDRFNGLAPDHITVKIAQQHEKLQQNTVYFADNFKHLTVRQRGENMIVKLQDHPPLNGFVASADYLFESMAKFTDTNMLGVILSGLGHDGAAGMAQLKNAGGYTVGESEQSCLVYGMSRAAAKMNALDEEQSLNAIVNTLNIERGRDEDRRLQRR